MSGLAMRRGARTRRRTAGFTYLWLLLGLALSAALLAAIGERVAQSAERDREAEWVFRGDAIARALAEYSDDTPGDRKLLPRTLEELVEDRRDVVTRHHLRRLYTDPFTGLADWVLLTNAEGQIEGVHSRSNTFALRTFDLPPPEAGAKPRIADRVFRHDDPALRAAQSAASAPVS